MCSRIRTFVEKSSVVQCSVWSVFEYGAFNGLRNTTQYTNPLIHAHIHTQVRYIYQLAHHLATHDTYLDTPRAPPYCTTPHIYLHELQLCNNFITRTDKCKPIEAFVESYSTGVQFETMTFHQTVTEIPLNDVCVCGDVRVCLFEALWQVWDASCACGMMWCSVVKWCGVVR